MPDLAFFVFLVTDGALAGSIYALVALAFVVVYKASRMINFAVGEWTMLGARTTAAASHMFGLGLAGAIGVGCAAMVAVALLFNQVVLRPLRRRSLLSLIMLTIGVGMFMRASATVVFAGIPSRIASPFPLEPLVVGGLPVSIDKIAAAAIAAACIAALSWFFHGSRTGLALRAVASDQQVALAVGIDLHRHFAITWGLVGVLSVLAGTLWSFTSGGGFGIELLGFKVFPIVILGGLDSLPGTIIGAFVVGILESLVAGYLDPIVGGGFSHVASYLVLIATLFVRPWGLFGRQEVERV
ncbi:MAG: branched-chain amino acid ABC transporter permease [Candidatus Rokuibacteriota bacterium]|nr:MAG: branched-chain amino acid ABC transporter permease [Candidatus Rokubacteria bacterium]